METIKKTLRDSAAVRWFVVFLVSGLTFGTYWFQDFFSGIKPMMESQMGISSSDFGALIGITTFANMIGMIILGGIILDKWGIRLTGIIFALIASLGAGLTALGSLGFFSSDLSTNLIIMMAGRILFGTGLEVICVLVTRTIVKWFKGYEMALAMALNMGFGRLGSAMGTAISPDIAGVSKSVPTAVTFAAALIGVGFIMFLAYIMFDIKLDKQQKGKNDNQEDEQFKINDLVKLITNKSFVAIALLCVAFYSAVFPFMQYAPDLLINKFSFTNELPANSGLVLFGSQTFGTVAIYLGLFIFSLAFTLIPLNMKSKKNKIISIALIATIFSGFMYYIWDTLAVWLQNGPKTASLIPLATLLFTPIFGSIVDRKGKAASLMILGALLLIFAHLSLSIFNSVSLGYMGLISLGIAFSLVPAAMWPSVAKIVPENRLGTAYATMFTVQNWGLGAFFWGIGKVLDLANPTIFKTLETQRKALEASGLSKPQIAEKIEIFIKQEGIVYNYTIPILMLVALGVISIFLAFLLKKSDKEQGYGLELPTN